MFEPLLITLSGLLDRVRGDSMHYFSRVVDKLLYGWVIAALFGHEFDYLTLPIAIAMALGMSPGWGDSWSAFLEKREIPDSYSRKHWWQPSWVKKSKWISGLVRGTIWGLPVAALGFFDPVLFWAIPIYIVAYIGGALFSAYLTKGNWEHGESFRGLIAGSLVALATNYELVKNFIVSLT